MPVTFRGALPMREDDGSGSGSSSHAVNLSGIFRKCDSSGRELRPIEIGLKPKQTQLLTPLPEMCGFVQTQLSGYAV
jgi:hypothetical protein